MFRQSASKHHRTPACGSFVPHMRVPTATYWVHAQCSNTEPTYAHMRMHCAAWPQEPILRGKRRSTRANFFESVTLGALAKDCSDCTTGVSTGGTTDAATVSPEASATIDADAGPGAAMGAEAGCGEAAPSGFVPPGTTNGIDLVAYDSDLMAGNLHKSLRFLARTRRVSNAGGGAQNYRMSTLWRRSQKRASRNLSSSLPETKGEIAERELPKQSPSKVNPPYTLADRRDHSQFPRIGSIGVTLRIRSGQVGDLIPRLSKRSSQGLFQLIPSTFVDANSL
jgi:hypothetical protein